MKSKTDYLDELAEIRDIERKWQAIWDKHKIFEADPIEDKPKFFITVPYPYTSGPLHIGHGRTYTIGDVIARYKRLRGFNVLFPMAFHITGTPIASISDRIKDGDPVALTMYRNYVKRYENDPNKVEKILESFKEPFNVAGYFSSKIQIDFKAIGFSIDWRRRFHTGEKIYNKFVEWQFKKLKSKNYITRGSHSVTFCLYHKQPEGEDDIKDADVNPVEILEFVAIKFEFEDGYLVAGTLRPETIFGATNFWVNPKAKYVKFNWNGETLYMSKEAVEKFVYQKGKVNMVEEYDGDYFIGKKVKSPLGKELLILPAEFVDPDNATGFVYSEPSDAPIDYVALEELKRNPDKIKKYGLKIEEVTNIEPIKIIDIPGVTDHHAKVIVEKMGIKSQMEIDKLEKATKEVYRDQYYNAVMREDTGPFAGLKVSEAKEKVKNWLIESNKAFIFYETSRKAECRAGGKIIVATIRDQWFIDYSGENWKNATREWLDKMFIYPKQYKKLFNDTVNWLQKRPCARKRGLGTRLPFDRDWVIESLSDSTIYMALYTIIHHLRKKNIDPEKLDDAFFNYIFLGQGNGEEVAGKLGLSLVEINEMKKEFEYWYPNDLRHTSIAHITNHLTFFIMHHIAIFPQKYWPRAITLNNLVTKDGRKMSKSKGNVVYLRDIAEKFSADLFRLYAVFSSDLDGVMDWREEDVADLRKRFIKFYHYLKRVSKVDKHDFHPMNNAEKWFISTFNKRVKKVTELMENFKFRDAIVELVFNQLSDILHLEKRIGSERAVIAVRSILDKWIVMLSPFTPHISEEIWDIIGGEGYVSVANWPSSDETLIDPEAELKEKSIREVEKDIQEIVKLIRKKPSIVKLIIASEWKRKLFSLLRENFQNRAFNVGEAMGIIMKDEFFKTRGKEVSAIVTKIVKNRKLMPEVILDVSEEIEMWKDAKEFLEKAIGCRIEILTEDNVKDDKEVAKAKQSLPMKPGIIIY